MKKDQVSVQLEVSNLVVEEELMPKAYFLRKSIASQIRMRDYSILARDDAFKKAGVKVIGWIAEEAFDKYDHHRYLLICINSISYVLVRIEGQNMFNALLTQWNEGVAARQIFIK